MNRTTHKSTFQISFLLSEASSLGDRAARAVAAGGQDFALESHSDGNVITLHVLDEETEAGTVLINDSKRDLRTAKHAAPKARLCVEVGDER